MIINYTGKARKTGVIQKHTKYIKWQRMLLSTVHQFPSCVIRLSQMLEGSVHREQHFFYPRVTFVGQKLIKSVIINILIIKSANTEKMEIV